MIVCGQDGVQRLIVKHHDWWVVEDAANRECLTGGFKTRAAAERAARAMGAGR